MLVKFSLTLLLAVTLVVAQQCQNTPRCVPEDCELPDCVCTTSTPGFSFADTPQLVYLTFDDGFTALAESSYYSELFDGTYTNPNGCPIRATHFLSHLNTDYTLVHRYRSLGHEMASHSITHHLNPEHWEELSTQGWLDEMAGMKTMINLYADVPLEEVVGTRAPFLQGGGDAQMDMMRLSGFQYDASLSTRQFGYTNIANGLWPFTYDYLSDMDCNLPPCPTCQHPGLFQSPMLQLEDNQFGVLPGDPTIGANCAMLDQCVIPEDQPQTAETVFDMLRRNFDRVHDPQLGNTKAPFGLYLHAAWFFGGEFRFEGYKQFLDYILSFDDVWVVPVKSGIEYRKNPVINSEVGNLPAFQCDNFPENTCTFPQNCRYTDVENDELNLSEVFMNVCTSCPDNFPWLGNPSGQ